MFFVAPKLTEFIVKLLVKRDSYSMVNIIRPGTVNEILQDEVNPKNLASNLEQLLNNNELRSSIKLGLSEVARQLSSFDKHPMFEGTDNVGERVAKLALETIATLSTTTEAVPQSGQFASDTAGF